MIHTRYRLAYELCAGKDVLEAACGPGRALGYLSRQAKSIVGCDFTRALVDLANQHYGGRIKVVQMDAQSMTFPDRSFDLVILYEALYYLPRVDLFLSEVRRVLRPNGVLLLCTPNCEWPEFNPSPFSRRYYSAAELRRLLEDAGFAVEIKAGFPVANDTFTRKIVAAARKTAIAMGLVPKTMKGKAFLKRLFYGRLVELTEEIDATVPTGVLVTAESGPITNFKVLYAIARLRG